MSRIQIDLQWRHKSDCQDIESNTCIELLNPFRQPAQIYVFGITGPNSLCLCYICKPIYSRMRLCQICSNKRCPHATNHNLECTNSNEPDQPGSAYSIPYDIGDCY